MAFEDARNRLLSTIDPLFISNTNTLTLIYRGERTSIKITPDVYSDLKAISHIPLTVYSLVFDVQSNNYDLSSSTIAKLKTYLRDIRTIRDSLKFYHSLTDVLQTQYDIIDLSIDYLRSLIKSKHLDQAELKEFCLNAHALFLLNLNGAVRPQLALLHSIVMPWYTDLFNETERQTVKVVVAGPHSAHIGFFTTLYFKALFGLNGEQHGNTRVVFVENVYDQTKIKNALGTYLLDEYAGDAFYNDSKRLHRELMMDDAMVYLQQLFPSKNI